MGTLVILATGAMLRVKAKLSPTPVPPVSVQRMIGEFPFVWLNGDGGEETSLL
jgi:hypothetical protein